MPKHIIKKSFLLFAIAFAVIGIASFGLRWTTKPAPVFVGNSPNQLIDATVSQNQNGSTSSPQIQKPVADKNISDKPAARQKKLFIASRAELFPVKRVIDGDTIVVNINGSISSPQAGKQVHVRLIGINSPELNDKRPQVACLAKKAKEEAKKLLDGKNVYLEKDPTQGDYDKYGRLLAYVFTEDGIFFDKVMIEKGYGYEYTYRLPYKYQSEFKTAQNEARIDRKGLWGNDICGK